MKKKNILSLLLFISIISNILPPLLGRWVGGETFAQQLAPRYIRRASLIQYSDSTRSFLPVSATNINGEMVGLANSVVLSPYTSTPHLYMLDSTGNYKWLKTYQFSSPYKTDYFDYVLPYKDSLYIIGRTRDGASGYADSYLPTIIKTDYAGNIVWKKKWGETGLNSVGVTAKTTCTDGGIALCGYTYLGSVPPTYYPKYTYPVIKYNADGSIKFNKAFFPVGEDSGGACGPFKDIIETPDKGYLISAVGRDTTNGGLGLFLLKLDANGNKLWDKLVLPTPASAFSYLGATGYIDMVAHPSGGYIVVADYNEMIKISETGDVEWNKKFTPSGGGFISFDRIILTTTTVSAQGFILSGSASERIFLPVHDTLLGPYSVWSNSQDTQHSLIIKTDLNGNLLWTREYGTFATSSLEHPIFEEPGGSLVVNTLASPKADDPTDLKEFIMKPDDLIYFIGEIGVLRLNHNGYLEDALCTLTPKILEESTAYTYNYINNISDYTTAAVSSNLALVTVSSGILPTITYGVCSKPIFAGFTYRINCPPNEPVYTVDFSRNTIGASWFRYDFGDPSSGVNNFSDSANVQHTYQNPGTYTVTLTVWDGDSTQTDTYRKAIVIEAKRYISILPKDTSICQGGVVKLQANISSGNFPPCGFVLINGNMTDFASSYTDSTLNTIPLDTSLRFYISTYGNTCVVSDTASITVLPKIDMKVAGNTTICTGDSTVLIASGSATYLWSPGSSSNDSLNVYPTNTTIYKVSSGQTKTCGVDSAKIQITVNALPMVDAGTEQTIYPGQQAQLLASGGIAYFWSPALGLNSVTISNPIANPIESTTYSVAVTDANGCVAYDTVRVDVNTCGENVFVPTAFSPNGDGQNDVLSINTANNNCIQTFDFKLFNRWGNLVFESSNITIAWDGTFKNKVLDADVFVYYLNAVFETGDVIIQKGNVSLIR